MDRLFGKFVSRRPARDDSAYAIRICRHVVTLPWLQDILIGYYAKRHPRPVKVVIKSHCVIQMSIVSSILLSDVITLSIQAEINNEPQNFEFTAKLLPLEPFTRFFVTQVEFDLREVEFYNQVITDFKRLEKKVLGPGESFVILPVAKCYLAKYVKPDCLDYPAFPRSPNNYIDESFIILENLMKKGYNRTNFIRGLTPEQAESAFDAISRIHALSLVLKVREGKPLDQKYDFFFAVERAGNTFSVLMETALPKVNDFLEPRRDMKEIINLLELIKDKEQVLVEKLLEPTSSISAITHNNFWSNNLLFKDKKCAIFDWQMVNYSQPTNDLAFLAITSLSPAVRTQHESRLLEYYWTRLLHHAKKLHLDVPTQFQYDLDKLREDYKKSQLLALIQCIGSIEIAINCDTLQERLISSLQDMYKNGILNEEFIERINSSDPLNEGSEGPEGKTNLSSE